MNIMATDKTSGRIVGVLLLIIFILGITIFQFLQGSVLFGDEYLTQTSSHSFQIIFSALLGILSGILSVIIAVILLPVIKRQSPTLGPLYIAFCILYFIAIAIDNISILSMLELSNAYVQSEGVDLITLTTMGGIFYQIHWWTHYLSLLISCFPVFTLFYTFYFTRLIPILLSIFGMFAALLMLVEILFSIFGHGISMNMMIPIALIQVTLPLWLIIRGFVDNQK